MSTNRETAEPLTSESAWRTLRDDIATKGNIASGLQPGVEEPAEVIVARFRATLDAARAAQDWLNGADVPHVDTALATLDAARAAQDVAGQETCRHDAKWVEEFTSWVIRAHEQQQRSQPATPPPDALREARERLEALLPGTLADDRDIAAALDDMEQAALHAQGVVPTNTQGYPAPLTDEDIARLHESIRNEGIAYARNLTPPPDALREIAQRLLDRFDSPWGNAPSRAEIEALREALRDAVPTEPNTEPKDTPTLIGIVAAEALGAAIEETPWPPVEGDRIAETRTGHGAVVAADLYRRGYVIRRLK